MLALEFTGHDAPTSRILSSVIRKSLVDPLIVLLSELKYINARIPWLSKRLLYLPI